MPHSKVQGAKRPTKPSRTILTHEGRRVASIELTPSGLTLLRKGINKKSWLPLSGKPHISFQRHHLLQAFDEGVTDVLLIASDGENWRAPLDEYIEGGIEFNHPTRGDQIAYPCSLFVHENPNQLRLF